MRRLNAPPRGVVLLLALAVLSSSSNAADPGNVTYNTLGINTVTLTVADNNGNESTCEATVTVEDNVSGMFTSETIAIQRQRNGTACIIGTIVDEQKLVLL